MAHNPVYGELLIRNRGRRIKFLADFERIPRSVPLPLEHLVDFVRSRRLHGKGAGWIDIHLLASALHHPPPR